MSSHAEERVPASFRPAIVPCFRKARPEQGILGRRTAKSSAVRPSAQKPQE